MRYAFALDLVDDAQSIADYEQAHQRIWPEVCHHLKSHGVLNMEIYRLGARLFMLMDVDPTTFNAEAMRSAAETSPIITLWERKMGVHQQATPWTPIGDKWGAMTRIFDLQAQD